MANAGDLTDLATARLAAGLSSSPTSDSDLVLGTLITAISSYVPQVVNRNILLANYSEIYWGNGKGKILLRQRPVVAISTIAWQGRLITAQGDEFANLAGIWTDGRSACLVNDAFPRGQSIKIGYAAGYPTVPQDISLAVAELVAEAYSRRTHVGELSRSQGGQTTISFDTREMHAAIQSKLQNYMHGAPC